MIMSNQGSDRSHIVGQPRNLRHSLHYRNTKHGKRRAMVGKDGPLNIIQVWGQVQATKQKITSLS